MNKSKGEENKVEVHCTGMLPSDIFGYMDWDNPLYGYWSETNPRDLSYEKYHGKYEVLYQKHQFEHGDIPKLFDAFLLEDDEEFRRYVVICVSRLKPTQEVFADLISRSHSGEIMSRALSVRALGLFSTEEARKELLSALGSDEAIIVRNAAGALAHHPCPDVEKALLDKLHFRDQETVNEVLFSLSKVGTEATERELLKLIENTEFFQRHEFNLLATLSAHAGPLTLESLPRLYNSGIIDDFSLSTYFNNLLENTQPHPLREKHSSTLRYLFLSHRGRINRAKWLVATIALAVGSRLVAAIPAGFDTGPSSKLLSTILLLNLWFAPAYALAAKRFQDRDKPGRTALYGLIPMQAAMLAWLWGLVGTAAEPNALSWICFAVENGTLLWFLIELGMLKGVRGPNRFGNDPLDPIAMRQPVEHERIIENPVFAYTVSAAGAVIMAAICNTLMWLLSIPISVPLFLLIGAAERGEGVSLMFTAGVWLTATGTAFIGFILSTPFARLALRVWPVEPFGVRTARFWVIVVLGVICLIPLGAFFATTLIGFFNYSTLAIHGSYTGESELQHAIVRFGWSSVLIGVFCFFFWAHIRAARILVGPFALFLRRFSTFADRSLVSDVIKSMPSGVRLVFIASRADHARNWNPFVWAFGGLRLFRPLKNLPIQVKTTDEAWIETVGKLVSRAGCIIVDLSATSPSIEVEMRLIARNGALDRLVVLADEQSMINAPPDDILRSAIAYSPSLLNSAVSSLAKVGSVLALWLANWGSIWGWLALLAMPYVVTPSVSRATRKAMRESIHTRIERSLTTGA